MTTARTLVHLRFDEPDTSVPPSDSAGSLADLAGVSNGDDPTASVKPALTGFGRRFSNGVLTAQDVVPGASLTTRDATIQVLIATTFDETDEGTIIARGDGSGPTEYVAYALELNALDANVTSVNWWWQDSAGNTKFQVGGAFLTPPPAGYPDASNFMLLTATRRWVSATRVELAYYAGGELLAEVVSSDGDIGGGTTGTMSIGADLNGPTAFLGAVIDELRVTNYVMSQEEIAATWDRIALHQPRGYRAMRDLMQPGAPISDDPSSRFQKLYRLAGHALGYAMAQIENARQNLLPDRAFGGALEDWERILREPARAADSIRARRDRLVAHFRQRAGVSVPGVRATLTKLLALAKSQIEVLSFSPTLLDSLLPSGLLPSLWWFREPAQWTRTGPNVTTNFASTDDVRHDASATGLHAALLALESQQGAVFQGARAAGSAIPAGAELGMVAVDFAVNSYLFFGVENNAGTIRVVYQQYVAGAAVSAKVVVATITNVPIWQRFRFSADGTKVTLEYSLTGPTTGFVTAVANLGLLGVKFGWIGFHCRSTNTTLGGLVVEGFTDMRLRVPKSRRAFCWYVYRDPALPGAPDIGGGTAALRRLKHAHTKAAVITNKQLLCDDPSNGCDLGPTGGY